MTPHYTLACGCATTRAVIVLAAYDCVRACSSHRVAHRPPTCEGRPPGLSRRTRNTLVL